MQLPPENEAKRLDALYELNILHTGKEDRFDKIIRVARQIFNMPIVGIGLVDANSVVYKSIVGLDLQETPRENSPSSFVVDSKDTLLVSDLSSHPVLASSHLARNLGVKFYVGVPLVTSDGFSIGDFFLADIKPQSFSDEQRVWFKDITSWISDELQKGKIFSEEQKMRNDLVSRNRELAREKALSDAMLADIGDGVIGINDKGEVIFINYQVELMTGFQKVDLVGKHLIQAIRMVDESGVDVPASNQPLRQALFYKKKVISRKYAYFRKDGKKFPVAITANPVVVYDQVIGGVVVFRDITKEMEIDRMKTEFISLASHQLRTPLSAMKWFCEILLDGDAGELTAEQKEMIGNVYKSNERMIDLVNTLLNISRIESGRIMIDPRPTDLKKLIDEIVVEIQPRLTQKKLKLAISVHDKLPPVSVDPKLIRHVYLNLLTNAIKYTLKGGEIIVIISKSGENVISQVSDNGMGIPIRQQDKVFKKFFRAENILKFETEGTGLGLYLAHAIVESSGGKIWFKSEEGKGTTFWFSLPLSGIKREGVVTIDS